MPHANVVVLTIAPWRPVQLWLAGSVVFAAMWVRLAGQHRRVTYDRDVAWWLWHWFTGGRLETGRTFPGDDQRAGIVHRVLVGALRTAAVCAVAAGECIRSGRSLVAVPVLVAVLVATTLATIHVAMRVAHFRWWVRPLHRAIFKLAGWPEDKRPGKYITIPRDREHGDIRPLRRLWHWVLRRPPAPGGVVVRMAPNYDAHPRRKELIELAIRKKLALDDAQETWVLSGRHAYVQFRPKKRMPERAMFADSPVRAELEKAKASAPVIGLTRDDKPVAIDLDSESPHVLLSAGTGGGKSSTIRTVAAQLMWHGADVTVIDVKRHSHPWLRGLPGVRYARDLGEIHRVLIELGQEGHKRNLAWDDVELGDKGPTFRRQVVICEELNATTTLLKMWWKNHRESGDPITSPAIVSLGQVLFMGRAVRIHVLAVAQMATAKDIGGPEMRENFAVRILARYTRNAARMLVPECNLPASTRHPGRAQVCIGGIATETQVVFMTEHEARAWVADKRGMEPLPPGDVAGREMLVPQGKRPATVTDVAEQALSLVEASSDRGLGAVLLRHDALRQAARRDPEFPSPVGQRGLARLYSPAALQRWELNRPGGRGLAEPVPLGTNEGDEVDRVELQEQG